MSRNFSLNSARSAVAWPNPWSPHPHAHAHPNAHHGHASQISRGRGGADSLNLACEVVGRRPKGPTTERWGLDETERDAGIDNTSRRGKRGGQRNRIRRGRHGRVSRHQRSGFETRSLSAFTWVGKPRHGGFSLRTKARTGRALLPPMTSEPISSCWCEFGSYGNSLEGPELSITNGNRAGEGWVDTVPRLLTRGGDGNLLSIHLSHVPGRAYLLVLSPQGPLVDRVRRG